MSNQIQYSSQGQSEWLLSLINQLNIRKGCVFEAGANSPNHWSNSRIFIESGWQAYLVESLHELCNEWQEANFKNVSIYCEGIPYKEKGLEELLYKINVPRYLDVLFLDIDGGEYHLIKGLDYFRPKFICVEYDPSFPLSIEFVPNTQKAGWQASSMAFYKLMCSKNYVYIKSFLQDHIFASKEFIESIDTSLFGTEIGEKAFLKEGPKNLYQFIDILLGQSNDRGESGVEKCASNLNMLIENNYMDYAKTYYSFMLAAMYSMYKITGYVSKDYKESYSRALIAFESTYRHIIN